MNEGCGQSMSFHMISNKACNSNRHTRRQHQTNPECSWYTTQCNCATCSRQNQVHLLCKHSWHLKQCWYRPKNRPPVPRCAHAAASWALRQPASQRCNDARLIDDETFTKRLLSSATPNRSPGTASSAAADAGPPQYRRRDSDCSVLRRLLQRAAQPVLQALFQHGHGDALDLPHALALEAVEFANLGGKNPQGDL